MLKEITKKEDYYIIGHTPDEGEINDGEVITEQSGVMSFQQEIENFMMSGQGFNDEGEYDYDEEDVNLDATPLPSKIDKLDALDMVNEAKQDIEALKLESSDEASSDEETPTPAGSAKAEPKAEPSEGGSPDETK